MKSFSFKRSLAVLSACLLQAAGAHAAVVISDEPDSASVPDGAKITFRVVASSNAVPALPLAYTWRKQGVGTPVKARSTSNEFVIASAKNTDEGDYYVTVEEVGGGFLNSANANVVVNVRPKILTNPTAPATIPTASPTTNVQFEVALTPEGEMPFTYKWQKKTGSAYNDVLTASGVEARNHIFPITGLQLSHAGVYRVQVTNASGILVNSKDFTLKVNSSPTVVTSPPASFIVTHGSSGTLKVVAGGTAPFTYQWFKKSNAGGDFLPIDKATKSSLSIKGTDTETGGLAEGPGKYMVNITNIFTNENPPAQSSEVDVRVIRKPKILTQPVKDTINLMTGPQAKTLSVAMVTDGDEGTLTYQWYKDGKIIAGAVNSTLEFPLPAGATWNDRGSYKVTIKNEVGSVTSSSAVLTMISPPIITSQSPLNVFGPALGSIKLFVTATGTTPLTYAWYYRPIGGAYNFDLPALSKSATLSLSKLSNSNHRGYYTCRVKNAPKGLTGPGATGQTDCAEIYLQADEAPKITQKLTVLPYATGVAATPKIPASTVALPTKLHLTLGVSGTNRLTDEGDDKANPRTYKWFKNKILIPGATASEYLVNDTTTADTGSYTCEVSNYVGKVLSSALAITVSGPPSVTIPPVDTTGIEETTINLSVVATGQGKLTYQWQKYDTTVSLWGNVTETNISGKTSAKMSITSSSVLNTGEYRCVVTNEYGNVESASADVLVTEIPDPVIGPVAGISGVEFYPQIARTGEKVRIYGQNLNYSPVVKFGALQIAGSAVVYESLTSSLLVTVPDGASLTGDLISVTTKGKLTTSIGGGTDTTSSNFTRTTIFGNDSPSNATILTASSTAVLKDGNNSYAANAANPLGYVFYVMKIPSTSLVSVTCDGLFSDSLASVDISMEIYEERAPGVSGVYVGPDSITNYGNPRSSAIVGSSSESLTFVTALADTDILIRIRSSAPPGENMVGFGPFKLGWSVIPIKLKSNVTATVPYAPKTKVSLSAGDWQATEAIGMTTDSAPDSEGSPTVRVGGEGSSKEPVQLWSDALDSVSGSTQATASFRMSLEGDAEEGDDQFSWQITSSTGKPLGAFWVNAASGEMKLVEPDGTVHESIQHMTPGGGAHRFEFQVDTVARTWVGYIDGIQISEPAALPAGDTFGGIYAVWDLGADAKASGSSMLFSDFVVEGRGGK